MARHRHAQPSCTARGGERRASRADARRCPRAPASARQGRPPAFAVRVRETLGRNQLLERTVIPAAGRLYHRAARLLDGGRQSLLRGRLGRSRTPHGRDEGVHDGGCLGGRRRRSPGLGFRRSAAPGREHGANEKSRSPHSHVGLEWARQGSNLGPTDYESSRDPGSRESPRDISPLVATFEPFNVRAALGESRAL
jgi:hypothetical protein